MKRQAAWTTAAAASAASPLLAQAGPSLHADPWWLLVAGVVGPGVTMAAGELLRYGAAATGTYVRARALGLSRRESVAAAATTILALATPEDRLLGTLAPPARPEGDDE